jgi:hypothetical protein
MTPTESRMLNDFLMQLRQVQGIQKDPEAAALIADAGLAQPDALYLLVQRALLQDQALANASARIAVLEAQAVPVAAVAPSSFLDGGNNAWGRSAAPVTARAYNVVAAAVAPASVPVASAPAAATMPAAASPGFFGGGGGNFLGTMAATAAGVAGGALLFQGIGNLMGHHGAAAPAPQSNAFSSMADSVDKPAAAAAPVASHEAADASNAGVASGSEDVEFGDDDAMA